MVVKVPRGYEGVFEGSSGLLELPSVGVRVLRRVAERAEVLQQLRHPHIVRLLGYGSRFPVLVYEYAGLGSLEYQLARGWEPGGVGEVLLLAYGIADALRYIHSRGLVHGDIKPGNLFVFEPGVVKLGDFSGIRRLLARASSRSSMHYTVGWRAPEQVDLLNLARRSKEPGYENRVDVYQLGNLILYLLTGETIDGEDLLIDGPKVVEEALEGVEDDQLRKLLKAMMVDEPWKRPSSEEAAKILGWLASKRRKG